MTEHPPAAPRRTLALRLDRWLRERDRQAGQYDRTRRFREVVLGQVGPADWPHRVMALVGRDDGGNWGPPRVRDLYLRTLYPSGPVKSLRGTRPWLETTRDAMRAWDGVREQGEDWRCFDSQDDGTTVRVGYLGSDGRLHDTGVQGTAELRAFRRWLLWDGWVVAEWLGLRRWLYYRALNLAVDRREAWTCQATPDEEAGGYSHWHCGVRVGVLGTIRRRLGRTDLHDGGHRYKNYRWPGPGERVEYAPVDSSRWGSAS